MAHKLKTLDVFGEEYKLPDGGGKSAYEYAVDGGYKGTEEEFSAALAGMAQTGTSDFVAYDAQTKTGVEKAQARENIGAGHTSDELTELWAEVAAMRAATSDWPMLRACVDASGKNQVCGWYDLSKRGVKPIFLTEVHFVKTYTPTGAENETWNADADGTGSIKGYRTGTVVTISAEGHEKIRLNPMSWGLFAKMQALTVLDGLELIDASAVTTLYAAFQDTRVSSIDLSSWKMPNLETIAYAFALNPNLREVKLSKYGMPKLTNTQQAFFELNDMQSIDLGRGTIVLSDKTFYKCLNLKNVYGLGDVETIGNRVFVYTPNIKDTDLQARNIKSIGESAIRLSSLEDIADLSAVPAENVEYLGTRHERWSAENRAALKAVSIPTYYIDVPNTENQSNYTDINFGTINGEKQNIAEAGCAAVTMYHAWNAIHNGTDQVYSNFREWWTSKGFDTNFAPTNTWSKQEDFNKLIGMLGWSSAGKHYTVTGADILQEIVASLKDGKPVYASMHSANVDPTNGYTYHAVLIIGCNAKTRKLAVLDPKVSGTTGVVSWLSFEDIFTEGYENGQNNDYIELINYGT